MAEVSRTTADTAADVIHDESGEKLNTAERVGQMFIDIIGSVVWNNKGVASSRPASSTVTGDHYFATDTGVLSIWDGSDWVEIGAGGGAVDSVFSRTGVVVAATSDYDASQIDNDSGVAGATVADALDALDGAAGAAHALGGASHTADTLANLNTKISDADVPPDTRTITAGSGLTGGGDLSANRTLNVGAHADGSITVAADTVQATMTLAQVLAQAADGDDVAVTNVATVSLNDAPTNDAHATRKDYVDTPPTTQTIVASTTTSDGDAASVTALSFTPRGGRWPDVYWQGVWGEVGDLTAPFYFSGDSGTTARANGAVVSGDTLHFNGSEAGFELAAGESISIRSV
jgi:hypothetical protein